MFEISLQRPKSFYYKKIKANIGRQVDSLARKQTFKPSLFKKLTVFPYLCPPLNSSHGKQA